MKKVYAFFAAALLSASMFAQDAPTIAELAENYDGTNNVVLCVKFTGEALVCNDIYFKGTFSGWDENWDNCPKFRAVANHEGWYAAQAPYADGFAGKPIQAKSDGSFAWDYQPGTPDAWTLVNVEGGKSATLSTEYDTQTKAEFGEAGYYFYEISFWQNHKTPCVVYQKHHYTINLYAPEACGEFSPAAIGDFNAWAEGVQMDADIDGEGEVFYTITFEDEELHAFKFKQAGISDWSNQIQYLDTVEDKWKDCGNITLPLASADTTLVINYSDPEMYRWTICDGEEAEAVAVSVKLPAAGAPEAVEIIGSFGEGWEVGTPMTWNASTDYFDAAIEAKSTQEFKFRGAGSWDKEIQVFIPANDGETEGKWENMKSMTFGDEWEDAEVEGVMIKLVVLDFSNTEVYRWTPSSEGIENVVLTEKAQKVVVDGVLYIVRDNKMYNIHGAQVR